jgi:hypothetical protein
VGNVNLPTPVVIAGGALCLLGGYLIGVVAGPDTPDRTTGVVESYDSRTQKLCLSGDAVSQQEGADKDGVLCGAWQRSPGATTPHSGDNFRFVTKHTAQDPSGTDTNVDDQVLIYGDVVD